MQNVKAIQKINEAELRMGLDTKSSWHDQYKDSAYIFIGGLNYDLTEGDILSVFSQYGEIININLVRDKKTGKTKGFCFLAYEDQRSTVLAVDNLNGIKLCGRTLRVDHVREYRRPKDEDGNEIIEKGCAPKTPSPSPSPSISSSPEPLTPPKIKKKLKGKKKRKEKKSKKKKNTHTSTISSGSNDEMGSDEKPTVSKKILQKTSDKNRYRSPSLVSLQGPGPFQAAKMKERFGSQREHSPSTRRSSTQYRRAPTEVSERDRKKERDRRYRSRSPYSKH